RSPTSRHGSEGLPDDFFANYGFTIEKDVVLDLSCARIKYRDSDSLPYFPFVRCPKSGIDPTHPVSSGFQSLTFTFASSIALHPTPDAKVIELVKSSDKA